MDKSTKNLLLLLGVAGAGYYAYKKGMFTGGGSSESEETETRSTEKQTQTPSDDSSEQYGSGSSMAPRTFAPPTKADAVIDVVKTAMSIPQAIQKAKEISEQYKDSQVIIKTPDGQPNISVTKGKKNRRGLFSKLREKRRLRKKKKLSEKFLRQYKKASTMDCSKYKGKRNTRCIRDKQKAALFLLKMQRASVV